MFEHGLLEELCIPDAESEMFESEDLDLFPGPDHGSEETSSVDPEPQPPDESGALGLSAARRRADRDDDEDDDAFFFEEDDEEVDDEDEYEDDDFFEEDEEDEDFEEPEEEEEDE